MPLFCGAKCRLSREIKLIMARFVANNDNYLLFAYPSLYVNISSFHISIRIIIQCVYVMLFLNSTASKLDCAVRRACAEGYSSCLVCVCLLY